MGGLLQEKAALELERLQLLGALQSLRDDLDLKTKTLSETVKMQNSIHTGYNIVQAVSIVLNTVKAVIDASREIMEGGGELPQCYFQAGFSIGTDCPMHIAGAAIKLGAKAHAFHPRRFRNCGIHSRMDSRFFRDGG